MMTSLPCGGLLDYYFLPIIHMYQMFCSLLQIEAYSNKLKENVYM
jgi:hypothetical protein